MARELSSPSRSPNIKKPTHEQVAERAYQIFLERGRPEGQDQQHWFEAEAQLISAMQRNNSSRGAEAGETAQAPTRRAQAHIRS